MVSLKGVTSLKNISSITKNGNFLDSFSYSGKSLDVSTDISRNVTDIKLKPDGTKLYVGEIDSPFIHSYDLSTAGDITSATKNTGTGALGSPPLSLSFKVDDGSKLYYGNPTQNYFTRNLVTPWDISNFTNPNESDNLQFAFGDWKPDGTSFFALWNVETGESTRIAVEHATTPWDITTISPGTNTLLDISSSTLTRNFKFSTDGTKIYVIDKTNLLLLEFTLSTPWDITTNTFTSSFDISNELTNPYGLDIDFDNNNIYVSDEGGMIYQYSI